MQDRARPSNRHVGRCTAAVGRCLTSAPRVAVASMLSLALSAGCGAKAHSGRPLPVTPGAITAPDEFDKAISTYTSTGQTGPLVAQIAANPDDDRAGVWHEMLALAAYDRAWALGEFSVDRPGDFDPAPQINAAMLRTVADRYPDTFAASMARVGLDTERLVLESAAVQHLTQPVLNPHVVAFLSGDDAWVGDVDDGTDGGVRIDLGRFERRYAQPLKSTLSTALLDDGCTESMGYCRWFVAQFPDDAASSAIARAVKSEWRRRAHPPWKGKAHLQCAYNCTRQCKNAPVDLDDACFAQC